MNWWSGSTPRSEKMRTGCRAITGVEPPTPGYPANRELVRGIPYSENRQLRGSYVSERFPGSDKFYCDTLIFDVRSTERRSLL